MKMYVLILILALCLVMAGCSAGGATVVATVSPDTAPQAPAFPHPIPPAPDIGEPGLVWEIP